MEQKIEQYTFKGMNQDLSKSKHPNEYYYEGNNIRIISTTEESTGSVSNTIGNEHILNIPTPLINYNTATIDYNDKSLTYRYYTNEQPRCEIESEYFISNNNYRTSGTQLIVDGIFTKKGIVIFSTDNNGFDCIWLFNPNTYDIELKYIRNLGFSTDNNFSLLNNFENDLIDKIYWIDGVNQLRYINLDMSEENGDEYNLIDIFKSSLQQVSEFNINQPIIKSINKGGTHTSGMIQYAYNLYNLNGSQTVISPFSELISLDKFEQGGGELNEIVGSTPVIEINNIDSKFSNIKLYAIKYTSFGEIPSINVIKDALIPNSKSFTHYDDGSVIESLSLEEFLFLGTDIIIPYNFTSKKNRLIIAGYKEQTFDIDSKNNDTSIDLRAFSFPKNSTSVELYNSLKINDGGVLVSDQNSIIIDNNVINGNVKIDYKFSCINKNLRVNGYQYNSSIPGGEGKYLKYELKRKFIPEVSKENRTKKFFKDNELYRIGIQFYNKFGQFSNPNWIADFIYNLQDDGVSNIFGSFACLEVTLKPEFYVWLNNSNNFTSDSFKPVGYKILRADRTLNDRTIITQGIINPMISISNINSYGLGPDRGSVVISEGGYKVPSLMRNFHRVSTPGIGGTVLSSTTNSFPVKTLNHGTQLDDSAIQPNTYGPFSEMYAHNQFNNQRGGTFQYNKLMQLFSPDVTFDNITIGGNSTNIKIAHILSNVNNDIWVKKIKTDSLATAYEAVANNTLVIDPTAGYNSTFRGLIGHAGSDNIMAFTQLNRVYEYGGISNNKVFKIKGNPLIVEKGQGRTIYNNNSKLAFENTWLPIKTDVNKDGQGLVSCNTWGSKNITFGVEGDYNNNNNGGVWNQDTTGNSNVVQDMITIEQLLTASNFQRNIQSHCVGLAEMIIDENLIYVGSLYGGNSYESKLRSNYIEIGNYKNISENINFILNGGDTFVGKFKFTKLCKTDTQVFNDSVAQFTEIVECPIETTIDIHNRNDLSLSDWNSKFQPQYAEFHKYNKVYSQNDNLVLKRSDDYNLKKTTNFNTKIITTKLKTPGEIVDSWTDILQNETLELDGKYGNINNIYNFKDEVYAFQDRAISMLSIEPRVQLQATDGLSIELGKGNILYNLSYITTESGVLNKRCITNSKIGIYYYDALNKTINFLQNKSEPIVLSSIAGIHTTLTNKIINNDILINKPLLLKGVTSTYDNINEDIYFTFLQGINNNKSFTINYNEKSKSFVSLHDFKPPLYIYNSNNFLSVNPSNLNELYKHNSGKYNKFYDDYFKSYIILKVNPNVHADCIFDNIQFNSEVRINDLDIPNETLTAIRAWNEYQDSDVIPLVVGNNIKRKFRTWRAFIPRNKNTRERIRNPWIYLKLEFDNNTNKKLVLHDILVLYTV